jgi:hypothetical protein
MRSIEYLIQLFPDKTGKELLAIQKQDKLDDEKKFQESRKKELAIIEDYNKNGAYFKGRFGLDQRYYYKVTNVRFVGDKLYCDVEKIVVFLGEKGDVCQDRINIERSFKEHEDFDTYYFQGCTRVTKEDYDKVNNYLLDVAQFWEDIK